MKISHINPYVRYAEIRTFTPDNTAVRPYDNRIFYLVSGELEITLNKRKMNIAPHTLMYIPCGTEYMLRSQNEIKMLILNFDHTQKFSHITDSLAPPAAYEYNEKRLLSDGVFEDLPLFNDVLVQKNAQGFERRIYDMIDTFKKPSVLRCEMVSAKTKLLLTELAAAPSNTDAENTDRVIEYIKSNFTREITNEELGRLTGYHPYHLNRLMIKRVGMPMRKYVIALRLEKAKELLINTELSISEISERCGFNSTTYFSSYFKEKNGTTPVSYRKIYKNTV